MSLFTGTADGHYAVVDIETTGGSLTRDRITEVAVFVTDGEKILQQFHSLVNPERTIPMSIQQLTGIDNSMVRDAPKFYEIAKELVEVTEGHIFVAHNVSFDYNFIKAEFAKLGYKFNRKRLCTVRLSRQIIPGLPSYSLGKLCHRLHIEVKARHRAAGDALATAELLSYLIDRDEAGALPAALNARNREALLPPHLKKTTFTNLPAKTGVYYLHDKQGHVIYVGKANNIKQRMASHWAPNLDSRKSLKMKERVHDISYTLTGNELIALLLEDHEIKTLKPVYNTAQKRTRHNFGVYSHADEAGYTRLDIRAIDPEAEALPHASFGSRVAARNFLGQLVDRQKLCQKLVGLYDTQTSCFRYQIHQCLGACVGEEAPATYNARVERALERLNLGQRNLALIDSGREKTERAFVLIERGVYQGFGYFHAEEPISGPDDLHAYLKPHPDNRDVQRIVGSYLRNGTPERVLEWPTNV